MITNAYQWSRQAWRPAARASVVALAIGVIGTTAAWGLVASRPHTTAQQLAAQCNADARTIETAVAAYDANPPSNCNTNCTIGFEKVSGKGSITLGNPHTYWKGTQARNLLKDGGLTVWPSSSHFAISLAINNYPRGVRAGEALVYIPATNKHPHIYDDETSHSVCNGL